MSVDLSGGCKMMRKKRKSKGRLANETISRDLLNLMEWKNPNGEEQQLKLYEILATKWKPLSDFIGIDMYSVQNIEDAHKDSLSCVREVICEWLMNKEKLSNYPCTWNGIYNLLYALKLSTEAERLKIALEAIENNNEEDLSNEVDKIKDSSGWPRPPLIQYVPFPANNGEVGDHLEGGVKDDLSAGGVGVLPAVGVMGDSSEGGVRDVSAGGVRVPPASGMGDPSAVRVEDSPPSEVVGEPLAGEDMSAVDPFEENRDLTYPGLLLDDHMSEEQRTMIMESLREQSNKMILKFSSIKAKFSAYLRTCDSERVIADLKDILYDMVGYPPLFKNDHNFPTIDRDLDKANSIYEIKRIISSYCSFFNFDLLATVFDRIKFEAGLNALEEHRKDLADYAMQRICHFPSGLGVFKAKRMVVAIKLDDAYEGCTISHLIHFHKELCKLLELRLGQFLLDGLQPGCICIMLHLPPSLKKIFPLSEDKMDKLKMLKCHNASILSLSCEDICYKKYLGSKLESSGDQQATALIPDTSDELQPTQSSNQSQESRWSQLLGWLLSCFPSSRHQATSSSAQTASPGEESTLDQPRPLKLDSLSVHINTQLKDEECTLLDSPIPEQVLRTRMYNSPYASTEPIQTDLSCNYVEPQSNMQLEYPLAVITTIPLPCTDDENIPSQEPASMQARYNSNIPAVVETDSSTIIPIQCSDDDSIFHREHASMEPRYNSNIPAVVETDSSTIIPIQCSDDDSIFHREHASMEPTYNSYVEPCAIIVPVDAPNITPIECSK